MAATSAEYVPTQLVEEDADDYGPQSITKLEVSEL